MNERPEVTRLVMYEHGVAYLERSGPADGDFDPVFRRSDMNDVLKSSAAAVARGTAVGGNQRGEVSGVDETTGGTTGPRRLLMLRNAGGSIALVGATRRIGRVRQTNRAWDWTCRRMGRPSSSSASPVGYSSGPTISR